MTEPEEAPDMLLVQISATVSGEVRDADGNLLDSEGHPVTETEDEK